MSPDIQQSMDRFSVELYQKLLAGAGTDSSKNLFFSPLSVSAALMLAYAGAKGTTKNEIGQALNLQNSSDQDVLDNFQQGPLYLYST